MNDVDEIEKAYLTAQHVQRVFGPQLRELMDQGHDHCGIVCGLLALAAAHTLHDGEDVEALVSAARAAWSNVVRVHATEKGDSTT